MNRTNNFDGLRLIAAMAVLLSHMAALGGEEEWLIQGMTWGMVGVLVFFAISGYLVLASWRADPNIGRFLERRFLRIAPGLVVAAVSTYLLVAALGLTGFPGNPRSSLNGSLWTIAFEVYCYLLLLVLAMASNRPALWAVVALAVVSFLPHGTVDRNLVSFGYFFALSMLLLEYPQLRRYWWGLVGLGLATAPFGHPVSVALVVSPLAIEIGARSWPLLRSAGRYGDLSYGIYIYAFPIQQIVVAYMGKDAPYFALLAVSLPLVLLAALASWRIVEAPALARKPKRPAILVPDQLSGNAAVGGVKPAV